MARSAIAKSTIARADKKRLLGLVEQWERESSATASSPVELHSIIGAMPTDGVLPPPASSGSAPSIRFQTIRHAHSVLRELARDKHVELTELLDEVQAYELSIRQEVERREREGSLEEPS